jgi:multiple antibiotic resistance protein
MDDYTGYVKTIISLLAIVNPLGAVPVFISLTSDAPLQERGHIARISATSVAMILVFAVWIGEPFLHFFGTSIGAFRVAGGLLILLMGIAMLHGRISEAKHTAAEAKEAKDKESIAVVPLAIPLMAGPGAISLVIVDAHHASNYGNKFLLSVGVVVVSLLVWTALRLAGPLSRALGTTGINIATRVMGLILASVGVEFIATGLKQLLPGLG